MEEIKLRPHLFSHIIHKQHGVKKDNVTVFSNGAIMNGDYTNFNFPNLIEYKKVLIIQKEAFEEMAMKFSRFSELCFLIADKLLVKTGP